MEIKRVPTGIPGFDELVMGGIPTGSVVCLSGPAGSAKTLFGMQFIYTGATIYNEPGLYITVDERRENIVRATACYGMDVPKYEDSGKIFLIDMSKMRKLVSSKERLEKGLTDFKAISDFLENFLKTSGARRLVIDSLVALALPYRNMEELREEMFRFTTFLQEKGITSILLTEALNEAGESTRYGMEPFIGDGFITLGLEKIKGELRRTVAVRKLRFTKHDSGIHPFLITSSGIEISPEERVV